MESIWKLTLGAFKELAHELKADFKECPNDLPLDYIFVNPDVICVLENFNDCDKYANVYGWDWKGGLVEKDLPEADAYSTDPTKWVMKVKMVDVIKEFLKKHEIFGVAVLLKTFHNELPTTSKLLVYRFDRQKYEDFVKI